MQDRALFLEIILAARKRLILSYQGLDLKKNDKVPASAPLQELLEYCHKNYNLCVCQEKLHGFSLDYFDAGKTKYPTEIEEGIMTVYPSLSEENYAAAASLWEQLCNEKKTSEFTAGYIMPENLPSPVSEINLNINEFCRFFEKASSGFFKGALGFFCPEIKNDLKDDAEPFDLNRLDYYLLGSNLLRLKKIKNYDSPTLQKFFRETAVYPLGADMQREYIQKIEESVRALQDIERVVLMEKQKCEVHFSEMNITIKESLAYTEIPGSGDLFI